MRGAGLGGWSISASVSDLTVAFALILLKMQDSFTERFTRRSELTNETEQQKRSRKPFIVLIYTNTLGTKILILHLGHISKWRITFDGRVLATHGDVV